MLKIFITRRLPPVAKTLLSAHFQVEESQKEGSLDPHELLEAVQKYDALLCTLADVLRAIFWIRPHASLPSRTMRSDWITLTWKLPKRGEWPSTTSLM